MRRTGRDGSALKKKLGGYGLRIDGMSWRINAARGWLSKKREIAADNFDRLDESLVGGSRARTSTGRKEELMRTKASVDRRGKENSRSQGE